MDNAQPVKLECGVEVIPLPGNPHTTASRLHELQAYMDAHQEDVVEMGGEKYVERTARITDKLRNDLGTRRETLLGEVERESLLRSTNWIIDVTAAAAPTEFHVHRIGERGTLEGKLGGTRLLEFYSDKGCTLEFFRVDEHGKPTSTLEHVDVAPGGCLVKFNATNIAHSFQAKRGGVCLGVSNHPMDKVGSYGTDGIMNNTGEDGFKVTLPTATKVLTLTPPVISIDFEGTRSAIAKSLGIEAVAFYDPKGLLKSQEGLEATLRLMDEPKKNADQMRELIECSIACQRNALIDHVPPTP